MDRAEAKDEVFHPLQTRSGSVKACKSKIKLGPVVVGEKKITNFRACVPFFQKVAEGVEIAEAFGHFFMVDKEMLDVDPMADKSMA